MACSVWMQSPCSSLERQKEASRKRSESQDLECLPAAGLSFFFCRDQVRVSHPEVVLHMDSVIPDALPPTLPLQGLRA